jgi:hypothetical protein
MNKKGFLVFGIIIGMFLGVNWSRLTTVYRLSCDTSKYGWMWTTQERFDKEGFTCRNNENQKIQKETDINMIRQIVTLELL